jgi:hypothetical protein
MAPPGALLGRSTSMTTMPRAASQPRTPAAGALDPDAVNHPELRRPLHELDKPAGGGRDRSRAKLAAQVIQRRSHARVGVGVDPERDSTPTSGMVDIAVSCLALVGRWQPPVR